MTPHAALAWVGVGFVALLALTLIVELMRPTRRHVRAAIVDAHGEIVSTVGYVTGDEPAEVRLPDGTRLVVESVRKK